MFQLRIYSIATPEAAEQYFTVHWQRHIESLKKFGIQTVKVFREVGTNGETRVIGLVRYEECADVEALNRDYMSSAEFRADMEGFDMRSIRRVETVNLISADYI